MTLTTLAADSLEEIRLAVYRSFATKGRSPDISELGTSLDLSAKMVRSGLRHLANAHHLVLDEDDEVLLAHPFAAVPLGFAVMGSQTLWWGGCAWDSFALPHLVSDDEVLVSTRCPACSSPHVWNINRHQPPEGDQVAHFLVPTSHMWENIIHTCSHQRIFCSIDCVDSWLATTKLTLGYVMDLPQLWRLAAHWYDGRLDYGYTRRDPQAASEYFRNVGLTGTFWGL